MISIIITAYKNPESTKECIKRIVNQEKFNEDFELIVACPDEPTKRVIMEYKRKYPKIIKYVKQEDYCPKNQLMNEIFQIARGKILIWTDGNKFFERDAIKLLIAPFRDERVGIVGGRIISMNSKDTKYGFWAHLLTTGLHRMRKKRFSKNAFIEHTANILAFRSGIINKIPFDVAEGSIISFLIFNKGYKTIYLENAIVHVKYPETLIEFFKQRARSAKAHMELMGYMKNSHVKYHNFYNEVLFHASKKTLGNLFQFLSFMSFMIFVQLRAFFSLRIRKNHYYPVWECNNTLVKN